MKANIAGSYGKKGFSGRFLGYNFHGAPEADIQAAKNLLAEVNAPCGLDYAAKAVGVLRVKTASKSSDSEDTVLIIRAFAEDLATYPRDVVASACREWSDNNKWFPTWNELKTLLESKFNRRRAMQGALGPMYGGKDANPVARDENTDEVSANG